MEEDFIREKNCADCEHCKYIGKEKYDCYDVVLFKCKITKEIIDEFHTDRKACKNFIYYNYWD